MRLSRSFAAWITLVALLTPLGAAAETIQLDLKPKICTLGFNDDLCETTVRAVWRSSKDESLCLIIVGRPEIKRCWERFTAGEYSVELAFNENLLVQLRDPQLENVLASAVVTIIREALQLRRKRRQPWNILY
jgi:Protein of unknown function (DUF3019)